MLMRKPGRTGLRVSALCPGDDTFGGRTDQKASEAVLDSRVEAAGNFIDLYRAHWDDRGTPIEGTLRAFDDLVRQGKVRDVGGIELRPDEEATATRDSASAWREA